MIFPVDPNFLIAPQAPLKTEIVDLFVFNTRLYFLFSFCLSRILILFSMYSLIGNNSSMVKDCFIVI